MTPAPGLRDREQATGTVVVVRKPLVLLVVALAAVATLPACGKTDQSATVKIDGTPGGLRHAAEQTLDKNTAKLAMSIDMTVQGQAVTMTADGAMDQANRRFQLSFSMKDLLEQVAAGKGESVPASVADAFAQPMTILVDGTVMYMHMPMLAALGQAARTDGKEWLKVDLAQADSALGDLLGSGGSGGAFGSDPTAFLRFLEGIGSVSAVGTEDVRGVSTTHFTGSFTLDDALNAAPSDRRDAIERALEGLHLPDSAKTEPLPFDVWVGDDGLVRKETLTLDYSSMGPPVAALGRMTTTMELYDFGQPVDITVPSDDEVKDMTDLMSSIQSARSDGAGIN